MLQDWPVELLVQPDAAPMVVVPDLRSDVRSAVGLPNILQKHLMPIRHCMLLASVLSEAPGPAQSGLVLCLLP